MAEDGTGRLEDQDLEELLVQLDGLLARVEAMPGAEGETARSAVTALTEVYGEAMARLVSATCPDAEAQRRVADDQLLSHLLALHRLHPDPPERRVEQAIAEIQGRLHGNATVELAGIEAGTAHLVVASGGCGSQDLASSVQDIVLGAAPELVGVEAVKPPPVTFIPVGAVKRKVAL